MVLTDGRVVEQGSHQELVEKRGRLYDLLNSQRLGVSEKTEKHTLETIDDDDDDDLVPSLTNLPRVLTLKSLKSVGGGNARGQDAEAAEESNAGDQTATSLISLFKFLYSFNSTDNHLFILAMFGCILCGLANPTHSCEREPKSPFLPS